MLSTSIFNNSARSSSSSGQALSPNDMSCRSISRSPTSSLCSDDEEEFSVYKFFRIMKYERLRLITYVLYGHQWPKGDIISPTELAKAGLFYLRDDEVQCAFCRGRLKNWHHGDVAMEEHRRLFPQCPFVSGMSCGNITIEMDPDVNQSENNTLNESLSKCEENLSIESEKYNSSSTPMFPIFQDKLCRRKSFSSPEWKLDIDQNSLVDAGFFFTGKSSRTRCFHCGLILLNWVNDDNPMDEHIKFFPKCKFMIETKGDEYIEFIQFKNNMIESRIKLETTEVSKQNDVKNIQNLTFDNFCRMKNNAIRLLNDKPKPQAADSFFERYIRKLSFMNDSQNLFSYLFSLDLSPFSSSPPSSTDESPLNHTSSSSSSGCSSDSEPENDVCNELSDLSLCSSKVDLQCTLCCDNQICIVFIPCGHQLSCDKCSTRLKACPVCRQQIQSKVRTYFAR